MKKIFIVLLSAALLLVAACTTVPGEQSRLSVLYVGQNPNTGEGYNYGGDTEYIRELLQTRSAEYMELLNQHFDTTLVYGEQFKPEMSANYDVTVFDALPMTISGEDMAGTTFGSEKGKRYQFASTHQDSWRWLPEDFGHATVFIAGTLNNMSEDVNLALKCLCNCLGKTAFNLKEDHPIFNTPNKVPLNYQETLYAGGVFTYYSGRNLKKSTAMIQMEVDDQPGKLLPPGIVTVPGVGDSPDTEVISGGTCIKDVDAIAIARHGNFFQWGFRASPRHMTEPAKLSFINSIHYIKNFKGAERIVEHKAPFRKAAMDVPYLLSDQGWAVRKSHFERIEARNQKVRDKVAAGTATEEEKQFAKFIGKPSTVERGSLLKQMPKELVAEFGEDWNRYLEYYQANMGYLYPLDMYHNFEVDKDAQALGIANNDVAILERSIELLEAGEQVELAQRVLKRYTEMDYRTASEWRQWLNSNRSKLFFTEVGGYKFMVNTL